MKPFAFPHRLINVRCLILLGCVLYAAQQAAAEGRLRRYALVLEDAPLAEVAVSREALSNASVLRHRARIGSAQAVVRRDLESRRVRITGAADTLINAVFVASRAEDASKLQGIPGVAYVRELLPMRRNLDRAAELVKSPAAWDALGGKTNAGSGVKIAIVDTGIDHTHAAFQDSALQAPSGFPKCAGDDCAYTNTKVIAARSYVRMLTLSDIPEDSRPDDLTPRDRVGHGTAMAMIAAGTENTGPAATITGIAPKAFLGNYKVFGSPGVNDVVFADVLIQALDDAFRDGMDIAVLSLGGPALWGPLDGGSTCGKTFEACDLRAEIVERASRAGLTVVVSAGNDGDLGALAPTLGSIHSPGTAPSAITVGATTNSHIFYAAVRVDGDDVPQELARVRAFFGRGPKPGTPLTAPLRDVASLQDDGKACSPLANGSLNGAIALILRGDCLLATKVNNAQNAGAMGAVIYQSQSNFPFAPSGLDGTGITAVGIANKDGLALKEFLKSNPDRQAAIDPSLVPQDAEFDTVAFFSSQGPGLPDTIVEPDLVTIKPELVAVGTDLYTATQSYDPNGEMWDPSGYTANADGTSFAAPMVAGAAALVKQRFPGYGPAQVKSAVVNTAGGGLGDYDNDGQPVKARVTAVGAGKLNAAEAIKANITAVPATISFGVINRFNPLPVARPLRIVNGGSDPVAVRLAVVPTDRDDNAQVTLPVTSFTLNPGQFTEQIAVRLTGRQPLSGSYEGAITVEGGGARLRIPYMYLVGDGVPNNLFPLRSSNFKGVVDTRLPGALTFKVVDKYGAPVEGAQVRFRSTLGGGRIEKATDSTDELGIAEAFEVYLGPQLGEQGFAAEAGGLTVYFDGKAILRPTIHTDGVVNAASGLVGQGLAAGSIASILGLGLSETYRGATTFYLPLSLAGISVSFDAPERGVSVPGRLRFVSENRIDLQIPWEVAGLNSVLVKVSNGDFSSAVFRVPLVEASPAFFETTEAASGRVVADARDESGQQIGTSSPSRKGNIVVLYANGLGPVDDRPQSGEPSPTELLSRCRVQPTVSLGGKPVEVLEAVLAPGRVGVYRITVRIPEDAEGGMQPLVMTVNGVASKASNLPVE